MGEKAETKQTHKKIGLINREGKWRRWGRMNSEGSPPG